MRDDWQSLGVAALGRAIQGDEIDPVELTDAALDAIDSHPHRDRIFSSLTPHRRVPRPVLAGVCWTVFRSLGRISLILLVTGLRRGQPC
jgi:hypothetical protein